ncbi:MAG: DUF1338 domain-containing protein [Planctomycetaceae bacterium]|nr:DUF1338 domain-containing protein [Planctomycetaceae bacterium]
MSGNAGNHKESAMMGPHGVIATVDDREGFTAEVFDVLWSRYRERVIYAAEYERIVREAGATFVNDHIALRTFACQQPLTGIASISRVFEALGYASAACYNFPNKHLSAIHFGHPNREFPKVFVSELRTWELSPSAQQIIQKIVGSHRPTINVETLAAISNLTDGDAGNRPVLLDAIVARFHELPWDAPEKDDVAALNDENQYAAWVAVHGYNVNHFTSLINSHGVESLDDIEKTIDALRKAGVPMKAEIEGAPGSRLRQSATEAAVIDVAVRKNGQEAVMPWTYAYMELAERGDVIDSETGKPTRFEGFLCPQAAHLFEMTKVK